MPKIRAPLRPFRKAALDGQLRRVPHEKPDCQGINHLMYKLGPKATTNEIMDCFFSLMLFTRAHDSVTNATRALSDK